jgi:Flp pilus assembly protein TadG
MKQSRSVRSWRFVRDQSGAALVEFALVATILMILIMGMIDFGRALYTKNSLTNAAREGGRFAAVQGDVATRIDEVKDTVISHMSPFGGAALTRSQITVNLNYATGSTTVIESTTIEIAYPFEPITPIAGLIGLDPLTLKASAQFRQEVNSSS